MTSVFTLQHCRTDESGNDNVKMIGAYTSRAEAEDAVVRVRGMPGFSEYPAILDALEDEETSGFTIDEYVLNKDHWTEGFVSA
nr:hypothetical protein [bacterium]